MNSWCVNGSDELECLAAIISLYARVVLLNLLFDVRELVLQVLTPLPFFQIRGVLKTREKEANYILLSFIVMECLYIRNVLSGSQRISRKFIGGLLYGEYSNT